MWFSERKIVFDKNKKEVIDDFIKSKLSFVDYLTKKYGKFKKLGE